jgi:serine/threonine protein kinase
LRPFCVFCVFRGLSTASSLDCAVDGNPMSAPLMQNERVSAIESAAVLNGRYHVLRPVGRGGMGAVYEAIDLRLRNTVAVKRMTAEGADARRAFEREARLLAALRHRALPVVIDYFIEDESCFLVMQFIEGEDLAALVRRGGACSEKDVQRWAAEVLAALVYLHGLESPVIHRDIKPANIKLTPRGDVVLLDFGLAKGQPDSGARPAYDDQSIYGFTPNYAPPEQLQFQRTDGRSDLYALGATLYHLVTGAAPPSAVDRSAAIGLGRPDPLTAAKSAATVSASFAVVLRRAMAIDPSARFASAADMLRALTSPSPGGDTEPARPHGLFSSPPPVRPRPRARRLDAATPSRAELDRPVDLLVQVRFADSPLLGLEDWPTRRKPNRIEQASEPVSIEHAVDPSSGRLLPARLRIKLVAPDFEIRGAGEQLIEVAPDEYSQRVAFLMTPRRTGYCRVNVEVYAADTVYLGAIAIESEVVPEGARQAPLCTADLILSVAAKEPLLREPLDTITQLSKAAARVESPKPPALREAASTAPPQRLTSSSKLRRAAIIGSAAMMVVLAAQVMMRTRSTDAPPQEPSQDARAAPPSTMPRPDQQQPGAVVSGDAKPADTTAAGGPAPPREPTDPAAAATAATITTLFVDVRPWARVKIVPPTPDPAVPADALYAPFAVDLPPGVYRFDSENGGVTRPARFEVTVKAGAPQAVTLNMPAFDATRAVNRLLAGNSTVPPPSPAPPATAATQPKPVPPPPATRPAPPANVDTATAQLQAELAKSPSLAELRLLRAEYEARGVSVDEVIRLIAAGGAVEARARGEYTGMVEFFAGNYQRSLSAIAEAEKAAALSPRGHFYRACSLASLATRGKTVSQTQLREARRSFSVANEYADQFTNDLRLISPRLLQLLKGS